MRESHKRKSVDLLNNYVNHPVNRRGSCENPEPIQSKLAKFKLEKEQIWNDADITNESEIQQENKYKTTNNLIIETKKSPLSKYSLINKNYSQVNNIKLNTYIK